MNATQLHFIFILKETGAEISNQVFSGCGRPVLGSRSKRALNLTSNTKPELYTNDNEFNERTRFNRVRRTANIRNQNNRGGGNRSNNHEIKYESMEFPRNNNPNNNNNGRNGSPRRYDNGVNNRNSERYSSNKHNMNKEPELDRAIKDIRQKVKDTKKFWSNLPYSMCEEGLGDSAQESCWNGHSIER